MTSALLAVLLCFTALSEPPRVAVRIEGGLIRFAPADIRLRVTVEPNEANRLLVVEADGELFYRSSDEDLTGESPRTRWIWYRALPAGSYTVTATVNHRWRDRQHLEVLGP